MTDKQKQSAQKIAVWILRIAVGAVFIYSGFVKSVDPWGFIFKLEEYFGAFSLTFPRSVTLVMTLMISGFEFVAGVLLATGCYRKVVPILLSAMMAVMLPLTLYLWIADPIEDCGCFGDAWKISNGATFLKNVFLTAALVYLLIKNKKVRFFIFRPALQWLVVVFSMLYIVCVGLISYNVQPMVDFRPYPEGKSLLNDIDAEEAETIYIYQKGNETREFSLADLPSDDSGWEFVEAIDNESESSENRSLFAIYNSDGNDVSGEIIQDEGKQFLMVIPEMSRADISYTYFLNELSKLSKKHDIGFDALLSTGEDGIEYWKDISMANYNCYSAEDTSLKELVRGTVALVLIEDGLIKWKRTVSSLVELNLDNLEKEYGAEFPERMLVEKWNLSRLTHTYIISLVVLFVIQGIIVLIIVGRRKRNQENTQTPETSNKSEQH